MMLSILEMMEIWPNLNRIMVIGDNVCVVDVFVAWKCTNFSQALIGAKKVGSKSSVPRGTLHGCSDLG